MAKCYNIDISPCAVSAEDGKKKKHPLLSRSLTAVSSVEVVARKGCQH